MVLTVKDIRKIKDIRKKKKEKIKERNDSFSKEFHSLDGRE